MRLTTVDPLRAVGLEQDAERQRIDRNHARDHTERYERLTPILRGFRDAR